MSACANVTCAGVALVDASGEMAEALRRLVGLWQAGDSFRVINAAPWVEPRPGTGHIECMTSGSRGHPKVIRRTLGSWQLSFEVNRDLFALGEGDRVATFGSLRHSLTLYGLMEALHVGARVEFLAGMRPDHQAERLVGAGANVLYATPTQLRLVTRERTFEGVRLVICGGGMLDAATMERARAAFPNALIRQFYGASETSFITLSDEATPAGSVGRAYPGVEIEIRDGVGGIGEIWVKSPYLFEGYAQGESAETRADGDFLTVGELGRLDDAGYLWLSGRRSRMVTISDRNVFPEEIEKVMGAVLGERTFAVIARRDRLRGNVLVAFVEGAADGECERVLRQRIRDELGAEMVPRRFCFISPFPMLASGKPDLTALEARDP